MRLFPPTGKAFEMNRIFFKHFDIFFLPLVLKIEVPFFDVFIIYCRKKEKIVDKLGGLFMKDYLNELCANLNIQLIYTDEGYTALSAVIKGKKASIIANKFFDGCPEKVARAIIGYYTGSGNEDSHFRVIEGYILDNIVTVEYAIEPSDDTFKSLSSKHMNGGAPADVNIPKDKTAKGKATKSRTPGSKTAKGSAKKKGLPKVDTSSLVELDISSMTKKSFYSGTAKVNANETIKASSDDVVELDIEVSDSEP